MKPAFVSVVLALLTACDLPTEPPAPKIPLTPDEKGSVVVVGRVVSAENATGLQAANVRVFEAGASVGTDETGRYRIVLPARFRGRVVPLNVRAIGYNAQTLMVAIPSNSVTVDVGMTVSRMMLSCYMGIPYSAVGR